MIRYVFLLIFSALLISSCSKKITFTENFNQYNNRTWINENLWPVPLEDWRIENGTVQCTGEIANMRLSLLTTLIEGEGDFQITFRMGTTNTYENDGNAGIRIAVNDATDNDIRSLCYFGKGIDIGVNTAGFMFIGFDKTDLPEEFDFTSITFVVKGNSSKGQNDLLVTCTDKNGLSATLTKDGLANLSGMISFVQNFEESGYFRTHPKFYFDDISLEGSNLVQKPENSFGPILFSMYTLSDQTLNITAQMPPLGDVDNNNLLFQIKKDNVWKTLDTSTIEKDARIAVFRFENWDVSTDKEYRFKYDENYTDGSSKSFYYNGLIRKEPSDTILSLGGLTCQEHQGYPYRPLVKNLSNSNPDMLYFSGDQIYEGNGGYGIVRYPADRAILNYLGKWYMFGWTFGEVMKDRPTICIPDDHEVYQGNLWGSGGKTISQEVWAENSDCISGFVQPVDMVNVVVRTNCSHLPAPYDATPMENEILVYYTSVEYAGIGFAIVGDRIFKSGPEEVSWWNGRKDHLRHELDNPSKLSKPGLKLLGDRQMEFLNHWADDWNGKQIKVLLSQTPFAYSTTHHGANRMLLYGDLDSGGWPKPARDSAIAVIRRCKAFHVTGDQHLTTMVQYGIDEYRDAGWVFCTPAISVGYPRRFLPDQLGWKIQNRPDHNLPNTGEYTDGFGNKNYIYAVGNPDEIDKHENRYIQAELKASGYGMIYFNKVDRNVRCEAIRFLPDSENNVLLFTGWPVNIDLDNGKVIQ